MRHPKQSKTVGFGPVETDDVAPGRADLDLSSWIHALRLLPAASMTDGDTLAWVEGPLRKFFPFERFWIAYGNLSRGRMQVRVLLSGRHDPAFLASRESISDVKSRSCFAWWVAHRRAFLLDKTGGRDEAGVRILANKAELEDLERFSLGVVAAHGVIDPFVPAGTYVSFSGVPRSQPKRTLAALDLIAPVLHTLVLRTKQPTTSVLDLAALTDRQRELVDLALQGLPDKTIASRLAISDSTVGNHLRAIYAKLGISKRSQLIALLK
jgi:DNA-binding CsgD family transcriptional regulator